MAMFVVRDDADSMEQLRRRIVAGAAEAAAHLAAWLALVAELDEREGWADDGAASCAHWLGWRCGLDRRTAREHVRVARALRSLPAVAAAFGEGRLSYSKVRAVCRVATPEIEAMVLEWATTLTASQLERVVSAYARVHGDPINLDDAAARRAKCGAVTWVDGDGLHHTELISAPEDGRLIDLALDYGREQVRKETREPVRGPQGRLDALLLVLRRGLVNGERGVIDESRHLLITHVPSAGVFVDTDGNVDLGEGVVVHPQVLQRLGCDALVQGVLDGIDGRPLDLGRRARTATRDQKVALMAQYPACVWGGCTIKSKDCQFHHLDFWEKGGRTDLANLRPLCPFHHRKVHEGGWRVVIGVDGDAVMIPPDGRAPIASVPPLSLVPVSAGALCRSNRRRRVSPGLDECASLAGTAGGEALDRWALGAIIDGLVARAGAPPALE